MGWEIGPASEYDKKIKAAEEREIIYCDIVIVKCCGASARFIDVLRIRRGKIYIIHIYMIYIRIYILKNSQRREAIAANLCQKQNAISK